MKLVTFIPFAKAAKSLPTLMKITRLTLCILLGALGNSFGQNPAFQLPTDERVPGTLTQGFNESDHKGASAYAIDISIASGTTIIAPVDGLVVYGRYKNGNFSTRVGMYQQIDAGVCPALIRDDDPNSPNALWTVEFFGPSMGETWTIFHVSEQTLRNLNDPSGMVWVSAGTVIAKTGGAVNQAGRGCSTGQHAHVAKLAYFDSQNSPAAVQSVYFDLVGRSFNSSTGTYSVLTISGSDLDAHGTTYFNAHGRTINGSATPTDSAGCGSQVTVGGCSQNPQSWIDASYRDNFNSYVTGPKNNVHNWGSGCIQDFNATDAGVSDALMQPNCTGTVFQVYGGVWNRYQTAGGATSFIGYPTQDRQHVWSWNSGFSADMQQFQGAIFVLHTDYRSPWRSNTFAVQGAIRDRWASLGGNSSSLGFPTSDEYTWTTEFDWWSWQWKRIQRTDFERGAILWHELDGSINVWQY